MGSGTTGDGVAVRNSGDSGPRSTYLLINSDGSINVNTTVTPIAATVPTSTVVSVTNAQTQILAANASRRQALVQNHGASVLQIHFTNGQAFGAGPLQLPQYATWSARQEDGLVYRGIVYGIRAVATENAGVVEET